jgi:glucosamine-6-phosphate deaminase
MSRITSRVAPEWWDYTTLNRDILDDAAKLTIDDLRQLERPGFEVHFYETVEEFYLAEALEYIDAWRRATPDNPCGICGPVGPTEQLPLVARLVNALDLNLANAHFWGMDEWVVNGKAVDLDFPLGFAKADYDLCFNRIRPELQMPSSNLHFPSEHVETFQKTWNDVHCCLIQGGQGETKHWAFNDPPRREGNYVDVPPPPEVYRKLATRVVELHPMTLLQNARTSGGGVVQNVPFEAVTVGPVETWKADTVSIWHPGHHDNPFGIRLSSLMISKCIIDTSVPMSLLADHPDVRFNYLLPAIGSCTVEMH